MITEINHHKDTAALLLKSIVITFLFTSPSLADTKNISKQPKHIVELGASEVRGSIDTASTSDSASQGKVNHAEIAQRPLSRIGEVVEFVPGMIATQHSGSGKANQFFLRGFNLDHGTDFQVRFDGVPLNLRSHTHGQGYLDLNSIIPELIEKIEYGKGPYYAEQGDFSSAGYAHFHTLNTLPEGLATFTIGQYDDYRGVVAHSTPFAQGNLLYGGEIQFSNGPWDTPEHASKYNGILRYSTHYHNGGYTITGKAYHSQWTATNQIPQSAILSKQLDRYGTMDPSDGGITRRYVLSSEWWSRSEESRFRGNLYGGYYDLDLYSNFTGYLDDPVHGDQLQQKEHRVFTGVNAEQNWSHRFFDFDMDTSVGLDVQYDGISGSTLAHTQERVLLNTMALSDIEETSLGVYIQHRSYWLPWLRSVLGWRSDTFWFDVHNQLLSENSGTDSTTLLSPKCGLVFGPWRKTELFFNAGYGFHSNDARGVTAGINPLDRTTSLQKVQGLSRQRGVEGGVRTHYVPGLMSSLAVWYLRSDSELVFVGDAGTTEPTGRSERYGIEWTNEYRFIDWLTLDADVAFTSARYVDTPHDANAIPNSIGTVVSAGAVARFLEHGFANVRIRHFGQVPLNESGTAWAGDTTLVNIGIGYEYQKMRFEAAIFNLLDTKSNDIAYFYASRYPSSADAHEGIMLHPVMPRQARFTIHLSF